MWIVKVFQFWFFFFKRDKNCKLSKDGNITSITWKNRWLWFFRILINYDYFLFYFNHFWRKKIKELTFLDFSGKPKFFHCELFYGTTFEIVLGLCIVHMKVFIEKYMVSMFRISFGQFLMILILIILTMKTKLCRMAFWLNFFVNYPNQKTMSRWALKKPLDMMFSDVCLLKKWKNISYSGFVRKS